MIKSLHADTVEGLSPDEPITMLNLMRFRTESLDGDGSGWDAYVRYSVVTNKLVKARGGRIVWAGEVNGTSFGPEEHGLWDYTALVDYPTPGAFLDMMHSPEYAEANVQRENGCLDHLIMAVGVTFNGLAK